MVGGLFFCAFGANAETSASGSRGAASQGGGMAANLSGASAGMASAGVTATMGGDGLPLQPLLTNSDALTSPGQDNVNQVEQIQGGTALNLDNEFQKFLAQSVGRLLPMYGYNLFAQPPSTFAPVGDIPVPQDYAIGPGDEIILAGWGQVDIDLRVTVDRNGVINLPKVGAINVAGVKYQNLESYLKNQVGRVFRNFELSASMGKLRSLQVFVVGQAQRPGVYTVSSLSTLVNTLFMSGGPSQNGTMRHIQLKRAGKVVTELDVYELLIKGDKSKDVQLLSGDVIYIPPIGHLAAISGSVKTPAIYELKDGRTSLASLLELSGGLTTTAAGQKVLLERIADRAVRKVEEFQLDEQGLNRLVRDGDLVQVFSIDARFDNAVTLRGNVASPGRYPWKEGMRVRDLIPDMDALIVPEYWTRQNNAFRVDTSGQSALHAQIKRNVSEVNWDYALVERLSKREMTTVLLPFNLGDAIGGKDAQQDLLLQPGDVITIFSKDDIQVPSAKRSVYVRLEGEFNHAGVYKAQPGETLRQLVARIGGLTPQAFLFAGELSRESTRQSQQKRLDEIIDKLEADVQRNAAQSSAGALGKDDVEAAKAQAESQKALIAKMRQVKATGRIVMEMPDENAQIKDVPDIVLEDGDRLYVPSASSTVNVMGAVYNQNAFLYKRGSSVNDYLTKSGGPTRDGDEDDVYLVRADGTVLSSRQGGPMFGGFGGREVQPGATIVVPEKLEKYNLTKDFKDWTQIFYQFAIGIASLKTIGVY
ncbi:MAG: SLBB domain-containing protein [Gallionella sp.]|nr:SLBB domain-containing protein [Gallionella sp.]